MRIALDASRIFAGHGTARTYLEELLPELVQSASEQDSIVLLSSLPEELPPRVVWLSRHDSFSSQVAPLAGSLDGLWRRLGFPSFERLAADLGDFDVSHSLQPPALPSRSQRRLVSLHSLPGQTETRSVSRSLQRADLVIVPSERLAERLREVHSLADDRVVVVHPGVNQRYVEPPKASDVETLCSMHPYLERPYLLALGSGADPDRGVPFLLEACSAAWHRDEGVPPLVLLASPSDSERITQAVREHPRGERVFVLESLPRELLPAFYRGAEMLLEPCLAGGLGQAALEASACGVPCLLDPSCGVMDILADAALTIEPKAEAWTEAIGRLYGDRTERERRGELGRERTSTRTWKAVAQRHWELYRA